MRRKNLIALLAAAFLLAGITPAMAQEPEEPLPMPGSVEGTGTYFEVLDSEYLNVTLESGEPIQLWLQSASQTISMDFGAADGAPSTQITLGGLAPSTTYYKYVDSYENGGPITTDASGGHTWVQDLSGRHYVLLQPGPSTKIIRDDATGGDCTAIGTWDSASKTCTLGMDVSGSIEMANDNLTLDGAGHTVQGPGYGIGIWIQGDGTTVRNVNVMHFNSGIIARLCTGAMVADNTVSHATYGISLFYESNNSVIGNDVSDTSRAGIQVGMDWTGSWTYGCVVRDNVITHNDHYGILVTRGAGHTVANNIVTNNSYVGIALWWADSSTVTGNISSNNHDGISAGQSHYNTVTGNTVSSNSRFGIRLDWWSHDNGIYNNNFIDNPTQAILEIYPRPATGNWFHSEAPTGGNYWSDWTTPDADGDGFVDMPYTSPIVGNYPSFQGGQDDLPWTTPDGWLNRAPLPDAGENIQILSIDQAYTVVYGEATDPDADALQFRWLEGETVLLDWNAVGASGEAYLDLAPLPYLAIGNHTLTLEVTDGEHTVADSMVTTIDNSPPELQPAPSSQVIELGVDPIIIVANVADFDGDTVTYECRVGTESLGSGTVATVHGGETVPIPDVVVEPGDPRFPLGSHVVEMRVDDGVNDPVSAFVTVNVIDTTAPSLSPLPSATILWPPNHTLRPVTIQANAYDNGGGSIHLDVSVSSSELPDYDGDGNTIPDYYIDSVNDGTGVIELRLRSERAGTGAGRTYTIDITATDESGNASEAYVIVRAPHDRRKK